MGQAPEDRAKLRWETRLALAGRNNARNGGGVNPPVQHATTLLLDDVDDLYGAAAKTYALEGMAVHDALREALLAIEGGASATLAPSGLAACALALSTIARAGGELLVADCVYGPTRRFCDTLLARFGVCARYFDPRIGAAIAELISDATCGIFLESPGSLTFEIQDVPAIALAAHARTVPVVLDNTWSAGVYFKPFAHDVDISVQALTKYQAGHADAFMGAVLAAGPDWGRRIEATSRQFGSGVAPDDAYLVLRGLRTLSVRLERQSASALAVAHWLAARPEVASVLHPALAGHPDHALWRRDFSGASGVFGVVLHPVAPASLNTMLESCAVFAMGFSWGGYESLIVPTDKNLRRSATAWSAAGPLLRLSIGLEHPDDLIADLEQGFARLR